MRGFLRAAVWVRAAIETRGCGYPLAFYRYLTVYRC